MKFPKLLKPSFSEIQKDFLEKFNWCLKNEFKGEQLAIVEKIGCDKSSISRWTNKESAPPDYVCRLLLKELEADNVKQALGRRIQYLRKKVFEISLREFTWTFKLESLSQLEAIEHGETELPRQCIEMLMRDYRVSTSFLDYGEGCIFSNISGHTADILPYLNDGFKLYIITPPIGGEDRSWLRCRFVLHRKQEHLPQCFVSSSPGSFRSTGGGMLLIEDALWAVMENGKVSPHLPSAFDIPPVLIADKKGWMDLRSSRFYKKEILFGIGCADTQCEDKLRDILVPLREKFDSRKEFEKHK